ncbi:menaquinol-cytochrome c reductase iron-sulfur subunit precursor [Jatrophihabitans endophyticus]|uniref:Cytochrome bc1 complex Rieske iron-sulfur subunit n=1 Tax=Jatrophihabitans endophyticus TaxID=1206085 RepID=A0A1M5L277_9ACTN|nr:Rieske 2Fe-2S domain-containing protein [Jatrophihabitans endophyticus]SHG59148.1 menaquinol-cytochrome c reductase iron-sulfur subunit precursor [Jatrophihabitans endophyticus]
MSSETETGTHAGAHGGPVRQPTAAEIREMSPEDGMIAGAEVDGIHIVHRRDRFPIRGTKAEKRAERAVAACFLIAALAGVGFIVAFIAIPFHWHLPGTPQDFRFFTPALGALLATLLVFIGVGMVLWAKWLMPEEETVQDRHDEPSTEEDKLYTEATLLAGLEDTGLPRRSLILKTLGLAGGALATVPLVALVGAMIKKPGNALFHTFFDPKWAPAGEKHVPLVLENFDRVGPNDLEPGGLLTVFPGVRDEVGGKNGVTSASSPTLLIRLRPGQKVQARKGQASFGWPAENPEFLAFSKICTHAGCPASLYEQQTTRLLCPCHQSQFEVLQDAKPVFGPASRSLPKLPLGVATDADGRQYFFARSDYHEAIGPAFWERP